MLCYPLLSHPAGVPHCAVTCECLHCTEFATISGEPEWDLLRLPAVSSTADDEAEDWLRQYRKRQRKLDRRVRERDARDALAYFKQFRPARKA